MNNIVWLASYPKSGNTWFRAFLANLLRDGDEPVAINDMRTGAIASARVLFDEMVGIDASDLTADEIDALRPAVYRKWAAEHDQVGYHKIHDAFVRLPDDQALVPHDASRGALYFIRNPLDVAVSYSHHSGREIDTVIDWMRDPKHCFAAGRGRLHDQLRQRLLSWSGHVQSWTEQCEVRTHVLRYEDMVQSAESTFSGAAEFLGLVVDEIQIAKSVRFASFEELQRQETESGFQERAQVAEAFFRKGQVGSWRHELSSDQVETLIADHAAVMARFGYLDDDLEPVF